MEMGLNGGGGCLCLIGRYVVGFGFRVGFLNRLGLEGRI